jgi:LAO/AO transport system kinase
MGDGIQAAKAGILEIGDVYVVNKADRDGADAVRRDLRGMIALSERSEDAWKPPIVKTVAQSGDGIADVVAALDQHHDWLVTTGELARRRTRRAREEIEAIALDTLRARWADVGASDELDALAVTVAEGRSDPYAAADRLLGS